MADFQQIIRNTSAIKPVLHQHLIVTIKKKLKLPNQNSSFIAKAKILQYILLLHEQNEAIRSALSPASIDRQIKYFQQQCEKLRLELNKKQEHLKFLIHTIAQKDEDYKFMKQHEQKQASQVKILQKQIQELLEESPSSSSSSQDNQISFLMDKFINYFQQAQKEQEPNQQQVINEIKKVNIQKDQQPSLLGNKQFNFFSLFGNTKEKKESKVPIGQPKLENKIGPGKSSPNQYNAKSHEQDNQIKSAFFNQPNIQ